MGSSFSSSQSRFLRSHLPEMTDQYDRKFSRGDESINWVKVGAEPSGISEALWPYVMSNEQRIPTQIVYLRFQLLNGSSFSNMI